MTFDHLPRPGERVAYLAIWGEKPFDRAVTLDHQHSLDIAVRYHGIVVPLIMDPERPDAADPPNSPGGEAP